MSAMPHGNLWRGCSTSRRAAEALAVAAVEVLERRKSACGGDFLDRSRARHEHLVCRTVYVRFCTGDGKWSETVYLPDQPVSASGLTIFVR